MTDSALASSFVQAANFTPVASRTIDLVVIHDMEYPEALDAAEQVAQFFARQKKDPKTGSSAHYNVDTDSVVQSVAEHDVAWHAPGANHNGIGIEHAGYAAQRAEQWADEYSDAELRLSARLSADLCTRHKLPAVYVDAAGLLRGERGITTHWQVTLAFKRGSHTDPGPNFPMAHYVGLVRAALGQPIINRPEEDDVLVINKKGDPVYWFIGVGDKPQKIETTADLDVFRGAGVKVLEKLGEKTFNRIYGAAGGS